jgi:multiple sugar transport system permease protein
MIRKASFGKKLGDGLMIGILLAAGIVCIIPLLSILIHSFENYPPGSSENLSKIFYLPYPISIHQYEKALIQNRETLWYFWNSVKIALPVLLISTAISLHSGYALAKFQFPWKKPIFFSYVLVMLLPIQVGIVGTYIFFDKIHLLNHFAGVILPCAFSSFGAFLIYQFMKTIPDNTLESARLDGANEWTVFLRIAVPQAKAGISSMFILTLIDIWNLVETPMLLLKDEGKHPMSVMLRYLDLEQSDIVFAAIMVFTIPLLLLFSLCQDALSEGIAHSVPVKD